MARVYIFEPREQAGHFGLYRTSAGGDESIIVRRKVGEPTDYVHGNSKKLKVQRVNLALASRHWSHLSPSQKADWRRQIRWVSRIPPGSKSEEVILKGRELFISEEIHSLATTGKQLVLPTELCIMLVDEEYNVLEGELWLLYKEGEEWLFCDREELTTGSWLFSKVPPGKEAYRCFGQSENYYDPQLPELQAMTEKELLYYHYHVLLLTYPRHCYSEPGPYLGDWISPGERRSQPFIPCTDFNLRTFVINMMAYPYPTERPPSTGFIAIHETHPSGRPVEPALWESTFSIITPDWPKRRNHAVSFPSLSLQQGKRYSWVVGCPPPARPMSFVLVSGGHGGVCNPGIEHGNAESVWIDGAWTPWELKEMPFLFYEARG